MLRFFYNLMLDFWHAVLVGLCRLTGRDNFFFAICAVLVMDFCLIMVTILELSRSVALGLLFVLPVLAGLYGSLYMMGFAQAFRQSVESEEGIGLLDDELVVVARRLSVMGLYCGSLCILMLFGLNSSPKIHGRLSGLTLLFVGVCCVFVFMLFVLDYQPRGKSLRKRLTEWAKDHKPQFSWGGISPHPMPS